MQPRWVITFLPFAHHASHRCAWRMFYLHSLSYFVIRDPFDAFPCTLLFTCECASVIRHHTNSCLLWYFNLLCWQPEYTQAYFNTLPNLEWTDTLYQWIYTIIKMWQTHNSSYLFFANNNFFDLLIIQSIRGPFLTGSVSRCPHSLFSVIVTHFPCLTMSESKNRHASKYMKNVRPVSRNSLK